MRSFFHCLRATPSFSSDDKRLILGTESSQQFTFPTWFLKLYLNTLSCFLLAFCLLCDLKCFHQHVTNYFKKKKQSSKETIRHTAAAADWLLWRLNTRSGHRVTPCFHWVWRWSGLLTAGWSEQVVRVWNIGVVSVATRRNTTTAACTDGAMNHTWISPFTSSSSSSSVWKSDPVCRNVQSWISECFPVTP